MRPFSPTDHAMLDRLGMGLRTRAGFSVGTFPQYRGYLIGHQGGGGVMVRDGRAARAAQLMVNGWPNNRIKRTLRIHNRTLMKIRAWLATHATVRCPCGRPGAHRGSCWYYDPARAHAEIWRTWRSERATGATYRAIAARWGVSTMAVWRVCRNSAYRGPA